MIGHYIIACFGTLLVTTLFIIESKRSRKLKNYLDQIKEAQQQHTITISNMKIHMDTHHEAHKNALHSLAERHHFLQKEVTEMKRKNT